MRRTFALFGAGLLLGAGVMYFASIDDRAGSTPPAAPSTAPSAFPASAGTRVPAAVQFLTLATGSVSSAERATLFALAAEADRRTLESWTRQVAALPRIEGRRLALQALLVRHAELDAPAAAELARTLGLEADELAPLYTAWARRDASAALQALGTLGPREALTLAIAVLEVIGNDDLGVARVIGAAPQIDADRLRIEAAVAKAESTPQDALEDVLRLPPSKSSAALKRIGVLWARRDVHGALAAFAAIEDEQLRNELKVAVLREWAMADTDAMLAYLQRLDETERNMAASAALQALAEIDPLRALRAADALPGGLGGMVRRVAIMTLARDDPLGALRQAESLPAGAERDQIRSTAAQAYGRADPDAAIAWAKSIGEANLLVNVLAGVARVDPDRAIELLEQNAAPLEQQRVYQMMVMSGALSSAQTAALADRLASQPRQRPGLRMLIGMWAQRAPEEAVRWMLSSNDRATPNAMAQAGMSLARTNPAAAIGYLGQMSAELRPAWLSAVADGYAQNDPRAAAAWVAQHRGEAGYDAATAAVAMRMAGRDPAAAAELFGSIDHREAPDAPASARAIATAWARQDPAAAASWARELGREPHAATAAGAVAAQWAARDASAARSWALRLPADAARDAAVVQVLAASEAPAADSALLEAFSTPAAQESGVNEVVRLLAPRDPAGARQLADRYLTDPGARQAAERFIEQGSNGTFFGQRPPQLPRAR